MQMVKKQYEMDHWIRDAEQIVHFDEPRDSSIPSITLKVLDAEDKEQKNWLIRPRCGCMVRMIHCMYFN